MVIVATLVEVPQATGSRCLSHPVWTTVTARSQQPKTGGGGGGERERDREKAAYCLLLERGFQPAIPDP